MPPAEPSPHDFNLAQHVLRHAAATPDKIALAVLGPARAERWSYARLEAAVRSVATGLTERGLTPGDRILLRLGNTPHFPVAFLGAIAAGLVPVPTSAQLTEAEITKLAEALAPRAMIAAPGIALPTADADTLESAELETFYDLTPAPYHSGDAERPAYIIFTSGTSGRPRGVVHAHRAILARQMMHQGWYGLGPNDRVLHAGAFNWTYTLGTGLLDPWSVGATALIPAHGTEPGLLPLLLKRHDASIFAAAPGVYRQLLRAPFPPLPKLRHGLSAGEKLPPTTAARWTKATGTPIFEAYGMSECSTFVSGSPARPAPPGTLGHPQDGRRVALLDDSGTPDPVAGEIAVHRSDPGLMLGYLGDEAATGRRFAGDWFRTGDMGRWHDSGALIYEGRQDDMLNAGGFRVSPIEVEAALALHPDIQEVAAVQLEVKADASVIAAFYVAENLLDDTELERHCAAHLARYKQPRLFIRRPDLPRGANNKLLRRQLRDTWEPPHGET